MELIVVLMIALIIIGPKKLPGAAKSLGSSMRGFKESLTGGSDNDELPATTAATASTTDETAANLPQPAAVKA
jgi:sec-independent protein translocase protein TatA